MPRQAKKNKTLTLLKRHVLVPDKVTPSILETFPSPDITIVKFKTDEFTSLCPITGQPDWASITIEYMPNRLCLESKSLKLYLQSYRSYKGFAEAITTKIAYDLFNCLRPNWIRVDSYFKARGGVNLHATKTLFP